ncbi:RNA-dependent RNA polymerase 6 [Nymphaea thermarum]|nr:RNA-dependent RNA polymerase 6 [Nymphaea thermarum]
MFRTEEMTSQDADKEKKDLVITQVALGGFNADVSAEELTEFLEREVGTIWRCRLKRSWTPPDSYPDFSVADISVIEQRNDYQKVVPHAFVHFALPDSAQEAYEMAGRSELIHNGCPLTVDLGMETYYKVVRRRNTDPYRFTNVNANIGTLVSPEKFLVSWKSPERGVDFLVDPFDGTCRIIFSRDTVFSFQDATRKAVLKCDFKVEFSVGDIRNVKFYNERASLVMLLDLRSSPLIFYRTADDDIHVSVPFNLLDDEDPWIRTIDFTGVGAIGHCHFYKISFSPRFGLALDKAKAYFKGQGVSIVLCDKQLSVGYEPGYDKPNANPFFSVPENRGISFEVLFLVNCLVHKGIISRHRLSEEFYSLLEKQLPDVNIAALQHIYSYKNPIFDACRRLRTVQEWLLKKPMLVKTNQLSEYNVEVRRLVITPTKAYCLPPEVELSNRVLRKYRNIADRFIRVTFMDEGKQLLNSSALNCNIAPILKKMSAMPSLSRTTIFRRAKRIVQNGFTLCGRHYSFLAFSSNQLRGRSAWFFAEDKRMTAESIRTWMGKFNNKNVAKCAARMGQCFSSTYATVPVPFSEVNFKLPDIERNGYNFSDGIGTISPELAVEVVSKLQLTGEQPSAFQIRYAGCKGMVVRWPNLGDKFKLSLRPSMNKFESRHNILEIVAWTRFQPGFLNREIITLLSSLGVSDDAFMRLQELMVFKLDEMLKNADTAFEVLTTSCCDLESTAAIMLSAGFDPQFEPHLKSMLSCIRSGQLKSLLTKSRIFVPQSRWLLGCLDELAILEHGQCFIQVSDPSLLGCFAKHGAKFSQEEPNLQVITGTVVVAKNPCLHPGDVRILEAVDVPSLHHLVDCLVFPQKGSRPHPNEASGSDLDGDIYFVNWESDLIPPGKKSAPPMDYTPAPPKESPRPVRIPDVMEFFTKSMLSDSLGKICHAHVVHADLSELGANDEKCIKLAELAAIAVDFPKTGVNAQLPQALRPKVYPDFMGKDEKQSYRSEKVLGHLYRTILGTHGEITVEADHGTGENLLFDDQLMVPGFEKFLEEGWNYKCSYDRLLKGLLLHYDVHTEGELVTGYFVSFSKHNSKKQTELKDKLGHAYTSIKKEFRTTFETIEEGLNLSDDERNSVLEQKAAAWYHVTYHPHWVEKTMELKDPEHEVQLLLSFPWIAVDYLARIKIRQQGRLQFNTNKPINHLARYLGDKI